MINLEALNAPYRLLGGLLLAVIPLLLIVGFVLNRYNKEREGRIPKPFQLPQSFALILFAILVLLSAAQGTALGTLAALIAVGIAFGFLGDLFMADVFRQRNHVLYGMLAFAVGHVLYMLAFREIAIAQGLTDPALYVGPITLTWTAAFLLWAVLVRRSDGGSMQYIALGYGLFLASMAAYAVGLAAANPGGRFIPLAVGALLFLLSDTLIAARLFAQRRFPYIGDAIWITYIAAQFLIVTVTTLILSA